jgi:hypothetical protein
MDKEQLLAKKLWLEAELQKAQIVIHQLSGALGLITNLLNELDQKLESTEPKQ